MNKDLRAVDCCGMRVRKDGEQGRSMVEMLGVLAIVGVLSVGAIGGYSYAMNKHRTNELIYEATKRAQWVGTQLEMNNSNPSINTFGNDSLGGGRFTGQVLQLENGQIGIAVADLKEAVCDTIKNEIGDNTVIRAIKDSTGTGDVTCEDNGTAALIFNRDLSITDSPNSGSQGGNEPEPEEPQEPEEPTLDCGAHGEQVGNACACDSGWQGDDCSEQKPVDQNCSGHGYWNIYAMVCECNTGYYGYDCSEQTTETCADNDDCDEGYFCHYNGNVSCTDGPSGEAGKCVKVSGARGGNKNGYTWSNSAMDWYSAENFCDAQGKDMISISDLSCPYTLDQYKANYNYGYCCATAGSSIISGCNNNYSSTITALRNAGVPWEGYQHYWAEDLTNDSCSAFLVNLTDGSVQVVNRDRLDYGAGAYALCR